VHEGEVWWKVAVDTKFGSSWGGWGSIKSSSAFEVGLWKNFFFFVNNNNFIKKR